MTARERSFIEQSIKARWVDFVVAGRRVAADAGESPETGAAPSGHVKESIQQGDGDGAADSAIPVSAVPGEDVIVLSFEDSPSLVLHPATVRDLFETPTPSRSASGMGKAAHRGG